MCPPAIQEMTDFKNDLQQMTQNILKKVLNFSSSRRNIYEVKQD